MNESTLNCVRGLSSYFDFTNDYVAKLFVDQLISVYYSENKANSVKNLCLSDTGDTSEKLSRFNFYFKLLEDKPIDFVETVSVMRKRLPNVPILDIFHRYGRAGYDMEALADAFSRGQVLSKIWLVTELAKIQKDFKMIHVHAGWMGQIRLYLDQVDINYDKMRIFDIDPIAMKLSDKVFNNELLENWKVKSAYFDITDTEQLYRTGYEYKCADTVIEKSIPDCVISTSCEHFSDNWYHKLKIKSEGWGNLIAIQTNNFHSIEDHINTVHSLDEMKMKYPMDKLLYEGELELNGYTRYMLIGKNK